MEARMRKSDTPKDMRGVAPLVLGLGPGFMVGTNCHVAIEISWELVEKVASVRATLPFRGNQIWSAASDESEPTTLLWTASFGQHAGSAITFRLVPSARSTARLFQRPCLVCCAALYATASACVPALSLSKWTRGVFPRSASA